MRLQSDRNKTVNMVGKKVVLVSRFDFCASGFRIAEAINLHTNNSVNYLRMLPDGRELVRGQHLLNQKDGKWVVNNNALGNVNKLLDNADILHFKGDFLPTEKYFPTLNIKNKPKIISVSGMFFRRGNSIIAKPVAPIKKYVEETDSRVSLMADLNYKEFKGKYIPHPIDLANFDYSWKNSNKIVHCPSDRNKKGTAEIIKAVEGTPFDLEIIEGKSHTETLRAIKSSSMVIDQCVMPSYGNVTMEALAFGIPVVTYLSEQSGEQSDGILENSPIINSGTTAKTIREAIFKMKDSDMKEISYKSREFCETYHSYEYVGKSYDKIYKGVLC